LNQKIGVLFAEDGLYPRLSARENLLFHCRLRGLSGARVEEVLAEVGLVDHASVLAGRLPPGLARRLALGRAILHHPAVLLLVNPFAGCDVPSCELLERLIRDWSDGGAAVLILSSEMMGLAELCRSVYILEQGRIALAAAPQEERRFELPFKVPAKQEGQVALVNPADILYASTEDEQTLLHTTHGQVPSHLTLTELGERLGHNGFFRAHRGYLVNLQRVKSVVPYTRDSFSLILDDPDGTEIPLSKSAARELRTLLGY
jgi:ABC-2 type transport system ATP-binding protein